MLENSNVLLDLILEKPEIFLSQVAHGTIPDVYDVDMHFNKIYVDIELENVLLLSLLSQGGRNQ